MTLNDPLSRALLADIEHQVAGECRAIEEAGQREAAAIIGQAHAGARARVREALLQMRRDNARELRQAAAQERTRRRMGEEARTAQMLRRACPLLADTIVRRWQAPLSRRAWIEATARAAIGRLLSGPWTVEHPAQFSDADREHFIAALAGGSDDVSFTVCKELTAGLRVRAAGAVLDATPEALLADRPRVEAMLLATMASDAVQPAASPDGRPA